MNYIVPNEHIGEHECPLAIIKCVDFRFRESDQEFVTKGLGYDHYDLYAWPGAAKDVLNGNGFKKSFAEKVVAVSKNLHHVKKLLLLWHHDCGAYGGVKNFSSVAAEEEVFQKDLRTVRDMLKPDLPADLEIILAYSRPHPQGLEYQILE